jgi:hypothetical protein
MPISLMTGSLRVVRFLKLSVPYGVRARSDGDSRRRACFGRFAIGASAGRCLPHGARRVPPLVPVVVCARPSRNFEGFRSQPTKTDSRTLPRESQGSPRPRTPSLWRLETLGEAPCIRALQPFFTLVRFGLAALADEITTRGRFPR